MNPTLVQFQIADLHRQELLQQAQRARAARELVEARSHNLLRPVARRLIQIGEKLQESAPVSWSLTQPEAHLVK